MDRFRFEILFNNIVEEVKETRDAGQDEYAHKDSNIFANFERVGERLGVNSEKTLMVYLLKHIDGITAWVNGHKSQREDVRGRLKDSIVYLMLLWAMVEDESPKRPKNYQKIGDH
jgi:hypothetical protein